MFTEWFCDGFAAQALFCLLAKGGSVAFVVGFPTPLPGLMPGGIVTQGCASLHPGLRSCAASRLTRISHRLTGQAHDRPAITSLRLLAVLNVLSEYASLIKWGVVKRRAPRTDRPLMHFASPPDEKYGLRRAKTPLNTRLKRNSCSWRLSRLSSSTCTPHQLTLRRSADFRRPTQRG